MPQPNLRILIRSLRTKAYEKLEIQQYRAPLGEGPKGTEDRVPSQQEFDFGNEPCREINVDEADI